MPGHSLGAAGCPLRGGARRRPAEVSAAATAGHRGGRHERDDDRALERAVPGEHGVGLVDVERQDHATPRGASVRGQEVGLGGRPGRRPAPRPARESPHPRPTG